MDFLETLYSLKWLNGDNDDTYAYRNTENIGGVIHNSSRNPGYYACVYWTRNGRNVSEVQWHRQAFYSQEEAKAWVQIEWQRHVDALMEDAG